MARLHWAKHVFSILTMRLPQPAESDLTTQARIRDSAIELIGQQGFGQVTIREIARAAGVSPALVIHHYGTKERLRSACDSRVQQVFTDALAELEQHGPAGVMAQLARTEEYLPIVHYTNRTLRDGGPLAQTIFDHLVTATRSWLQTSVAAGLVRPSDDEQSRAKLLVSISFGLQFVEPYLAPHMAPENQVGTMVDHLMVSALELYTHGLFTGPEYLNAFFSYLQATPGEDHQP